MASKRVAQSPKRTVKRSRITKLIPTVVAALADADALPVDLRTLLKLTLPVTLNVNKSDRSSWEGEVVNQTEKALAAVQAAIEQSHADALVKQNVMISATEHQNRQTKKAQAEVALEAAKAKLEACKEAAKGQAEASKATQKAGQDSIHDAKTALKAAEKEAAAAAKVVAQHVEQKAEVEGVIAGEFALLRDGTSAGVAGGKAVKKLLALGKEYRLDSTLLQTFHITCKKPTAARSQFEAMMFAQLEAGLNRQLESVTQHLAEAEPAKAQKESALAAAMEAVYAAAASAKAASDQAEEALVAANGEVSAAHTAHKEVVKEVAMAGSHLHQVWQDMKVVCDAQDGLAKNLKNFQDDVLAAFQQLKEKEPEPEPVEEPEPVAEEAPVATAPAEDAAAEPAVAA